MLQDSTFIQYFMNYCLFLKLCSKYGRKTVSKSAPNDMEFDHIIEKGLMYFNVKS